MHFTRLSTLRNYLRPRRILEDYLGSVVSKKIQQRNIHIHGARILNSLYIGPRSVFSTRKKDEFGIYHFGLSWTRTMVTQKGMDDKGNNQEKQLETENCSIFKSATGHRLFRKCWEPTNENPRALVFVVHGFAEHCEWYDHVAQALTDKGLLVAAHDHVGHGQSDGQRAQIHDFEDYVEDTLLHVDLVRRRYPDVPSFLLGHSMGGAIGIRCVLKRPHLFKGMVSIGPLVVPNADALSPWKVAIGRVIASLLPSLPIEKLDCNAICRDPNVVKKYVEDPLVYHGGVRPKWGMCVLHALQDTQPRLKEITVALLTIQGDSDKLCDKTGANILHNTASSEDKKLSMYPGAFHQVHNEPDGVGERAIQEITSWLTERL